MSNSMHVPYCGFHLGVALWILYSGKTCLCVVMCILHGFCMCVTLYSSVHVCINLCVIKICLPKVLTIPLCNSLV